MMDDRNTHFLTVALRRIAQDAGCSAVLFGEFLDHPLPRVRTLYALRNGELLDNFSYRTENDPAGNVLRDGAASLSSGVSLLYPQSLLLRDFQAQAYAAVRVDFAGMSQKGIVAALWERPEPDIERILPALHAFTRLFDQQTEAPLLEVERERAGYAAFVHDEFFNEYARDSLEAISFSEYMPPVPLDLPRDALIERLMHTAHVIDGNQAMASLFGYPDVAAFLGATPFECNGPEKAPRLIEQWLENDFSVRDFESQAVDAQGEIVWILGTALGRKSHGKLTGILTRRSDITTRKRYEAAIHRKANHDALTGLPNRYWFQEHIAALISDHQARGRHFCIGLLDLNGFKEINDTLGHAVGDRILQDVAKRLLRGLKPHDAQIARLGGDEFAIVLPEIYGPERSEAMAVELHKLLSESFVVDDMQLSIGGSLGLAMFPGHSTYGDDLLRMADIAMYAAKREGLPFCWYHADLDHHSRRRLSLLTELGPAIEKGELFLAFQPIIDVWNGQLFGFEALTRWRHPQHGLIPPADFIPFAETSEVIRPLTRWVLSEAIRQGAEWRSRGQDVKMSVNISVRNLLDDNLGDHIGECLEKYGFPAVALELEVTESALMTRPAEAMRVLHVLRAIGLKIAIDDFGTGYSSLAYLARLPVNTLKVDQSFVRGMLNSKTDEQIVRSIVGLAHQCALTVVAEGIEDERTLEMLYNMGCDLAQGYLLARPMEAVAATAWMQSAGAFKMRAGDFKAGRFQP